MLTRQGPRQEHDSSLTSDVPPSASSVDTFCFAPHSTLGQRLQSEWSESTHDLMIIERNRCMPPMGIGRAGSSLEHQSRMHKTLTAVKQQAQEQRGPFPVSSPTCQGGHTTGERMRSSCVQGTNAFAAGCAHVELPSRQGLWPGACHKL
jgi:hypothetical protein